MKNTILASLVLVMVVCFAFVPAVKKNNVSAAETTAVQKKKTDTWVGNWWVSENSLNSRFHGHIELTTAVCDDVSVDIQYRVYDVLQYHTLVIPAGYTYGDDEWGVCPPAYSSESLAILNVTPTTSCGYNILY